MDFDFYQSRDESGVRGSFARLFIRIVVGIGLLAAAYWYVEIYRKSPQVALEHYLSALNSANTDVQWLNLSESSKKYYRDAATYGAKYPLASGLSARIAGYSFAGQKDHGNTWEADATLTVRNISSYSAVSTDTKILTNHYVMKREPDGWKVDLMNPKTKVVSDD